MVSWLKMMSRLPDENFEKKLFHVFKLLPFVNFGIENLIKDTCISKHFIASSFNYWVKSFYFSSN